MISKKYVYEYEDYEGGGKDAKTMADWIAGDLELPGLEEVVVGCWGESFDNDAQTIIDAFVEQKEKFSHIKSLYMGDMTFEECEVSWIEQGDYSKLWEALPNLMQLTIKGSNGLKLGHISHENLKSLEIICGGLPKNVLQELSKAHLPRLEKINLYIGVDSYGFDGGIEDIRALIDHVKTLKHLTYLGIGNSELQDEIAKAVMESGLVARLEVLDFSNGTLSDKGAKLLMDHKEDLSHLKKLDLHYHFLSGEMMEKLKGLGITVDLDEQNDNDNEYGNYPMLTE